MHHIRNNTTLSVAPNTLAQTKVDDIASKVEAAQSFANIITTYAGAIAHNQQSPLANLKLTTMMYKEIIPLFLDLYREARGYGLQSAGMFNESHIEFLQEHPYDRQMEHINLLSAIIENNLGSIKSAVKIYHGKAGRSDLITCNIKDSLKLMLANNTALNTIERRLIHVNYDHCFKYNGNSITVAQILNNLLENALYQIRKNGKGEIFINFQEYPNTNVLRFKDTAGGAPEDVVSRLFEGYFTTKPTGNGIGLVFCKEAMRMFGGEIIAQSVENEYMEFLLIFPKITEE